MRQPTAALMICLACNGDIEAVSWAPIDVDQLELDMDNPTAPLDAAAIAELTETPAIEGDLVKGLLGLGHALIATAGESPVMPPPQDLDVNLSGTQVYIRIACPGPTATMPDPEFRYGSFTIYSAGLSEDVIETWGAGGDFYAVVQECVAGRYVLDGTMRMFYDVVRRLLAGDFDIDWERVDESGVLDLPALDERDVLDPTTQRTRVLYTNTVDKTLVLEQTAELTATQVTVYGVDGEITCDTINEPPCPPL